MIRARLHVLSPVHIGCGDEYEPTSFVIHPDSKKLISFDMFEFLKGLDDTGRKTIAQIADKGSLASVIELYRFIFSQRSAIRGREVELSYSVVSRYLKVKELPLNESRLRQELNNFRIPRTTCNPLDNEPYIPGSSLKGSLRTGYLSKLAAAGGTEQGIQRVLAKETVPDAITGRSNARRLEEELLGGAFDKDPFRFIKISDFLPAENVRTRILYGLNRKKDEVKAGRGVPQMLEAILPGSVFDGVINIGTPLPGSNMKMTIDREKLFPLAQKFFADNFSRERQIWEKIRFKPPRPNETRKIIEERKNLPFLVRVGYHSGAESVTIEGNRKITVRGPGGSRTERDSATTIWLASEKDNPPDNKAMMPFGWAMLELQR